VLGVALRRSLPLLQQVGGVVVAIFGLYLLGALRIPSLMHERRVHLAKKPTGKLGTVVVGIAFAAGWTPCVGPVLASILFYAGAKATMAQGMLLLAAYAIGLGVPFFVAAVAFNWFFSRMSLLRPRLLLLQRLAGGMLVIVGILLFTGRFTLLSSFFAGFGQLIPLE
jgi:cytochrome c-type biogenesis protein